LAAYLGSVQRLLEADFSCLYLTHFGKVTSPEPHLKAYAERLNEVAQQAKEWVAEGLDELAAGQAFHAKEWQRAQHQGVRPELWHRYEQANPTSMGASGLRQWASRL
jgi:hypothetical protein